MKMEENRFFLSVVLVLLMAASAAAVPVWRTDPPGQVPTTYQKWTFDDDDNPALPEVDSNPFGTAVAEIAVTGDVHGFGPGWSEYYLGREGVWHAELTELWLDVPNFDVPNEFKEIWVEVGFRGELTQWDVLADPVSAAVTDLGYTVENLPDGWKVLTIGWRIEPNPFAESIYLSFQDSGADVDYVTVDTICIPEPVSLCLLGLGGLILLYKRKRRTC